MPDPTTGVDVLPAVDQGGDILYLSNRRPPVAGVAPVSQDADWTPTSATARGLLDPGPLVSDAAVQRVLDVLRPLLGMGESPSGNRITNWYNQNVEYLASYTWAWCAATISYATTFGGADNIFKDRAYVPFVVQDAQAGTLGSEWHWGSDGMKPGDLAIFDWSGAGSATSGPPTTWASSSTTSPAGSGPPSRATSATPCSGSVVTDATCRATSGSIGQRPTE